MDAIQQKRAQAKQQGNLQSSPQMTVDTTTQNGQQVIEIKPADPQIIYVPQYNTETVYTTAPAQSTTTVVQQQSGVSTGGAIAIGLLSFGVGMAVGSALSRRLLSISGLGWRRHVLRRSSVLSSALPCSRLPGL
jgi:hypothetical protein